MNYAQIRERDIANGQGIRVSLFVSGCNFHCKNCFNQEYQNFSYGKSYDSAVRKYLLNLLSKPYISGLSILGGEPFQQDDDGLNQILDLVKTVKSMNKSVWIWTGFNFEDLTNPLIKEILNYTDVLVDGQYRDDLRDITLYMKGSSNQRVIDIPETLKQKEVILK